MDMPPARVDTATQFLRPFRRTHCNLSSTSPATCLHYPAYCAVIQSITRRWGHFILLQHNAHPGVQWVAAEVQPCKAALSASALQLSKVCMHCRDCMSRTHHHSAQLTQIACSHLHSPFIAGVNLEVMPVCGVQPQEATTTSRPIPAAPQSTAKHGCRHCTTFKPN